MRVTSRVGLAGSGREQPSPVQRLEDARHALLHGLGVGADRELNNQPPSESSHAPALTPFGKVAEGAVVRELDRHL
jgi:hypothetical protein